AAAASDGPAPEPFHSDEEDKLLSEELGFPVPPPQAFVTETMAELYLAQGFRDRAVNVFRQLVALRPEDERLRNRLAELAGLTPPVEPATAAPAETPEPEPIVEAPPLIEARRDESASEESSSSPPREVEQPSEEATAGKSISIDAPTDGPTFSELGSVEPPYVEENRAEPDAMAAPLTVRDFFASIGRRRPGSRRSGDDARAAAALAGAFGQFSSGASQSRDIPAPLPGAILGKESEEDVASFRAWLDGLTG
ncbi:MAG: tetratricopeptide repeat protein, partial [Gemmatimonadota bacterium]|nr:tetratricopeptide repeat protein [Gemmatimonadota bacterium]